MVTYVGQSNIYGFMIFGEYTEKLLATEMDTFKVNTFRGPLVVRFSTIMNEQVK